MMKSERKKRLLIIGSSQGEYGGIEAFMIALAEAASLWPEFDTRLCFKLVVGSELKESLQKSAEQLCKNVYFTSRGSKDLIKHIGWADILHIQNTPPDIILPAYLKRKKIFLTVHNWRKRVDNLHYYLWGFCIKLADRRWYNSHFVWNTWEPNKKYFNSDCVPTVCRLPKGWCPPEERKGFLFVGRLIENKGILELIQAYKEAQFNMEEWPLTILGNGPLRERVLKLLHHLELDNVSIPGFVTDDYKAKYLSEAKWVLAPANTREDLGLTPIEARSVGVPSIVTRDGGLPEAGGESALIAEPGDIESLKAAMVKAKEMNEDDYQNRCIVAKNSLSHFLKPIHFYRDSYLNDL